MRLSSSAPSSSSRHPGLDATRGLAAIAMVLGHTLDAVLAPGDRANTWVQRYWELRGMTAPLFLLVAGWAVVAALGTSRTSARENLERRVKRGLLLLFLGYLLLWPGLGAARALGWGEPLVLRLLAFDALQCIGLSLILGSGLMVLATGAWSRGLVLAGLAVGIPWASAAVWDVRPYLPALIAQSIAGAATTKFPLFPWAGYFFAGALGSHLFRSVRPGLAQGLGLVGAGTALFLATKLVHADWSPTSAWLVAYRVSQGLIVLGVMNLLPVRFAEPLRPFGKSSLWLYVMHLPIVYGWAGIPGLGSYVGQRLPFVPALLVGIVLLAGCSGAIRGLRALRLGWRLTLRPPPLESHPPA